MRAPNGRPTNLDERQWVQVRTPAFRAWFGDWENDPENASLAMDENGEPRVVYHGTPNDFTAFRRDFLGSTTRGAGTEWGFYFSDSEDLARAVVEDYSGREAKVIEGYLNIRNPLRVDLKDYDGDLDAALEQLQDSDYDGAVISGLVDHGIESENFLVLDGKQVKSATDNTGEFGPGADIRYSVVRGEVVNNRIAPAYANALTFKSASEQDAKASVKAWRNERRVFTNEMNGRRAEIKSDWSKIFSTPAKKKSASYEAHYAAANHLDTLFEHGVKMWEEAPRNGSNDIRAYAKYGCPFELNGDVYLAKITVKEYSSSAATDGLYSVEAISVEKIGTEGINAGITSIEGHELDLGATVALSKMLTPTPDIVAQSAPEAQAPTPDAFVRDAVMGMLAAAGDGNGAEGADAKPTERASVRRGGSPVRIDDLAVGTLAQRILAGKDPTVDDARRFLDGFGLSRTLDAGAALRAAREIAEANRERLKGEVERANPEVIGTLARANLSREMRSAMDSLVTGAARAVDPEVGMRLKDAVASRDRRALMAAKGFTAAEEARRRDDSERRMAERRDGEDADGGDYI